MSTKLVFRANLRRVGDNVIEATGGTDGRIVMGPKGTPNSFTPVELLIIAIAGCSGMDLCTFSQRDDVELGEFTITMRGTKPGDMKRLDQIAATYRFPDEVDPEVAKALVEEVSDFCTVALTVRDSCPIDHAVAE